VEGRGKIKGGSGGKGARGGEGATSSDERQRQRLSINLVGARCVASSAAAAPRRRTVSDDRPLASWTRSWTRLHGEEERASINMSTPLLDLSVFSWNMIVLTDCDKKVTKCI